MSISLQLLYDLFGQVKCKFSGVVLKRLICCYKEVDQKDNAISFCEFFAPYTKLTPSCGLKQHIIHWFSFILTRTNNTPTFRQWIHVCVTAVLPDVLFDVAGVAPVAERRLQDACWTTTLCCHTLSYCIFWDCIAERIIKEHKAQLTSQNHITPDYISCNVPKIYIDYIVYKSHPKTFWQIFTFDRVLFEVSKHNSSVKCKTYGQSYWK